MSSIRLYRLAAAKYAQDLSGEGARLYGGRWNKKGTPCIYAAESRALALLEYSVNVDIYEIPRALRLLTIEAAATSIHSIDIAALPGNWQVVPAPKQTQEFGNRLLEAKEHLLIKIPSSVVSQEFNYLINPLHPLAGKLKVISSEDFVFDLRIKE